MARVAQRENLDPKRRSSVSGEPNTPAEHLTSITPEGATKTLEEAELPSRTAGSNSHTMPTVTISGGSPSELPSVQFETLHSSPKPGTVVERLLLRNIAGEPTVFKHVTIKLPEISLDDPPSLTREQEISQKQKQLRGLQELQKGDLWKNRTEASLGVEAEGSLVHSSLYPVGELSPGSLYGRPAYFGQALVQRANRIFGLSVEEQRREKVADRDQRRRASDLMEDLSAAVEIRRLRPARYLMEDLFIAAGKVSSLHEANDLALQFVGEVDGCSKLHPKAVTRQHGKLLQQLTGCFTYEALCRFDLHFTTELAAHQWEAPSRIFSERREESFYQLEDDLRRNENIVNVLAARYGASSYSTGTLPSRDPSQFELSHHTAGSRYQSLFRGLLQIADPAGRYPEGYRKTWSVQYYGKDDLVVAQLKVSPQERALEYEDLVQKQVLRVENITVALESANTSMQVHVVSPDQRRHLAAHRATELLSSFVKAQAANASTLFSVSIGCKDNRFLGWQGTHPAHCDGVLPDEVAGWDQEPLSQISRAIEKLSAVLPIVEGVSKTRLRLGVDRETAECIDAAFQAGKTIWPESRETPYQTSDGRLVLGSEVRGNSAQPTPELTAAFAAEIDGLTAALPDYLAERYSIDLGAVTKVLEPLLPHEDVTQGRRQAERDGLNAVVHWPTEKGFRQTTIRDIWNEELFEVASQGMRERGYSEGQIRKVIGTEETPGLLREITNYQLPADLRDLIRSKVDQALALYQKEEEPGEWYELLVQELQSERAVDRSYAEKQLMAHHNRKRALENLHLVVDQKGWSSADIEQFVAYGIHAYGPELRETERGKLLAQFGLDLRNCAADHFDREHDRVVELSRNGERERHLLRTTPYRIHEWLESYARALERLLEGLPPIS